MRWAAWGLTSQGKTGDFKAIIWIFFFFFKENRQLCNLMQTVSGIFALKDAVGRNRSQNPFRPLLPDFYYYRALTANTASKLAISVTMAIKWVRFPSIMTWIVRTLQRARASAQGSYGGEALRGKQLFQLPAGSWRPSSISPHSRGELSPNCVRGRRHCAWEVQSTCKHPQLAPATHPPLPHHRARWLQGM